LPGRLPPKARRLPGERSFHIFYQLVRGADEALRAALRLPARPQDFQYLAQSGCLVGGQGSHGLVRHPSRVGLCESIPA
jgi:hypothetical protein